MYLKLRQMAHRDLKLDNILVSSTNHNVKLADFGCIKKSLPPGFEGCTTKTGTPMYMPPEILGESEGKDPYKHDMWSLGILLFQLLYKKFPWEGAGELGLKRNIENKPLVIPENP